MKNIVLICCLIALCGCDSDIFGGRKRVDLDRQKWEYEKEEEKINRQKWEAEQKENKEFERRQIEMDRIERKEKRELSKFEQKAQIDILIPEIEYKLAMASNDFVNAVEQYKKIEDDIRVFNNICNVIAQSNKVCEANSKKNKQEYFSAPEKTRMFLKHPEVNRMMLEYCNTNIEYIAENFTDRINQQLKLYYKLNRQLERNKDKFRKETDHIDSELIAEQDKQNRFVESKLNPLRHEKSRLENRLNSLKKQVSLGSGSIANGLGRSGIESKKREITQIESQLRMINDKIFNMELHHRQNRISKMESTVRKTYDNAITDRNDADNTAIKDNVHYRMIADISLTVENDLVGKLNSILSSERNRLRLTIPELQKKMSHMKVFMHQLKTANLPLDVILRTKEKIDGLNM